MHEFPGWLLDAAMRQPERLCFSDGNGDDYTYAEMADCVLGLGAFLQDNGVTEGDRVADVQRNDAFHFATIFALPLVGATRVPVNWRSDAKTIGHILSDAKPSLVIHSADPKVASAVQTANPHAVWRTVEVGRSDPKAGSQDDRVDLRSMAALGSPLPASIGWDDLVTIRYTGGTTGAPKGVLLPSRSEVIASLHIASQSCAMREFEEIFLHLQPLSHGGGAFVPPAVLRGSTNIVPEPFDPAAVVAAIVESEVTIMKLVPTMLIRLLSRPEFNSETCPSIKKIIYGASPMPYDAIRECVDRFGPVFVQGYGQTEVPTTITYLPEADHDLERNPKAARRIRSAGIPYATVQVAIMDDAGDISLEPGVLGEILVQGPHQMLGYNNLEDATREKIHSGWVRTGDIGHLDEDRYLYIVDRKSDMIVTGGWNVYPTEVENVLAGHPLIAQACVFGVPDPDWVEAVHAAVVVHPGESPSPDSLRDYCRGELANYMIPKVIHVLPELPVSPAGKVLRRAVRDAVSQRAALGAQIEGESTRVEESR